MIVKLSVLIGLGINITDVMKIVRNTIKKAMALGCETSLT